jgi:hypothetical protein
MGTVRFLVVVALICVFVAATAEAAGRGLYTGLCAERGVGTRTFVSMVGIADEFEKSTLIKVTVKGAGLTGAKVGRAGETASVHPAHRIASEVYESDAVMMPRGKGMFAVEFTFDCDNPNLKQGGIVTIDWRVAVGK